MTQSAEAAYLTLDALNNQAPDLICGLLLLCDPALLFLESPLAPSFLFPPALLLRELFSNSLLLLFGRQFFVEAPLLEAKPHFEVLQRKLLLQLFLSTATSLLKLLTRASHFILPVFAQFHCSCFPP